jgi:hypothetical protein
VTFIWKESAPGVPATVPFRFSETCGLQPSPVLGGLPLPSAGPATITVASSEAASVAAIDVLDFISSSRVVGSML